MKAIIIGGTGATGKELVKLLLDSERCTEVVALVARNKLATHKKLTQIVVDFSRLEDWTDSIQGDIAFSCMGTTLKNAGSKSAQWVVDHDYQFRFAEICKKNGVSTFVLLSAMNANSNSSFFYGKLKGVTEDDITALNFDKLIIARPGLLDRINSDRLGERWACKLIRMLNKVGLLKKHRPIRVNDLAYVLVKSTNQYTNKINIIDSSTISRLITDR